jgi:uncharacterized protein (TIGR02453 family)
MRVPEADFERALRRPGASPMDFTGRPLKGFVFLAPGAVRRAAALEKWVAGAVQHVREKKTAAPRPRAAGVRRAADHVFPGFAAGTFRFLSGLEKDNHKAWFDAHRDDYQAHYVEPALALVKSLGPRLKTLAKRLSFEPRVNGSLFRIQRDVRFSKDKTPYKAHLDLWFWEGEKKSWSAPGFFFRLEPKRLTLGAGIHAFDKGQLERFRKAVLDARAGVRLQRLVERVGGGGRYRLGGATRKVVPRGFDATHPRAALLLHEGLFAAFEGPVPKQARSPDFVDYCCEHFRRFAPLHAWLVELC